MRIDHLKRTTGKWICLLATAGFGLFCTNLFAQVGAAGMPAARNITTPTPDGTSTPPMILRGSRQQLPPPTLDQIPVGTPADIEAGKRIYLEGILPSGEPLTGRRLDGQVKISGTTAACVLCHRRSGLGGIEGNNRVEPISGRYLFKQDRRAVVLMNVRTERGFNRRHEPYTLGALNAAIRAGRHVSGREMLPLMPRYEMTEDDVRVLASYLRQLSATWSPGVTEETIRFATVITPDVDPQRKEAFLNTLQSIVRQRNGNIVHFGQRTVSSGAEMAFQSNRSWEVDVWELQGPPDTWAAQLKQRYAAQPVFALISGLGATRWEPVHEFCENNQVPCWFPSVQQAPDAAEDDFYSIYYTRGVRLEADVLARHLGEGNFRPRQVLQIYTDPSLGEGPIKSLGIALNGYHIQTEALLWNGKDKAALHKAMQKYGSDDAVMFWLPPKDMSVLAELHPPAAQTFFSGQLARGDRAPLNAEWKQSAHLIYPYQLPELRRKGLTYFHQWINERNIKVIDEEMQSEVYFSLSYLVELLVDMLDNVHRDFLLERAESELSLRESANAEDQWREVAASRQHVVAPDQAQPMRPMIPRPVPRPIPSRESIRTNPQSPRIGMREGQESLPVSAVPVPGSTMAARTESTTVYPRLSLAQFQRLASKGAYIVHFDNPQGNSLVTDTPWIVP